MNDGFAGKHGQLFIDDKTTNILSVHRKGCIGNSCPHPCNEKVCPGVTVRLKAVANQDVKVAKFKNKAKCKNCGDVIESKSQHDFVACSCWDAEKQLGIFVDGGNDYRRGGGNPEHFEVINEEVEG